MTKTLALCALAALVVGSACSHNAAVGTTTTTGAGIISSVDAVQRLTAQRCQREMDCNGIGEGKSYDDYATCEREIAKDLLSTLRTADACPAGIREDRMNACMKELRNDKCAGSTGAVGTLATCRPARLCIR